MLEGSRPGRVLPHVQAIARAFQEPDLVSSELPLVRASLLDAVVMLTAAMEGRGKAAVEAHFRETGRITDMGPTLDRLLRTMLKLGAAEALRPQAAAGIRALSRVACDLGTGSAYQGDAANTSQL